MVVMHVVFIGHNISQKIYNNVLGAKNDNLEVTHRKDVESFFEYIRSRNVTIDRIIVTSDLLAGKSEQDAYKLLKDFYSILVSNMQGVRFISLSRTEADQRLFTSIFVTSLMVNFRLPAKITTKSLLDFTTSPLEQLKMHNQVIDLDKDYTENTVVIKTEAPAPQTQREKKKGFLSSLFGGKKNKNKVEETSVSAPTEEEVVSKQSDDAESVTNTQEDQNNSYTLNETNDVNQFNTILDRQVDYNRENTFDEVPSNEEDTPPAPLPQAPTTTTQGVQQKPVAGEESELSDTDFIRHARKSGGMKHKRGSGIANVMVDPDALNTIIQSTASILEQQQKDILPTQDSSIVEKANEKQQAENVKSEADQANNSMPKDDSEPSVPLSSRIADLGSQSLPQAPTVPVAPLATPVIPVVASTPVSTPIIVPKVTKEVPSVKTPVAAPVASQAPKGKSPIEATTTTESSAPLEPAKPETVTETQEEVAPANMVTTPVNQNTNFSGIYGGAVEEEAPSAPLANDALDRLGKVNTENQDGVELVTPKTLSDEDVEQAISTVIVGNGADYTPSKLVIAADGKDSSTVTDPIDVPDFTRNEMAWDSESLVVSEVEEDTDAGGTIIVPGSQPTQAGVLFVNSGTHEDKPTVEEEYVLPDFTPVSDNTEGVKLSIVDNDVPPTDSVMYTVAPVKEVQAGVTVAATQGVEEDQGTEIDFSGDWKDVQTPKQLETLTQANVEEDTDFGAGLWSTINIPDISDIGAPIAGLVDLESKLSQANAVQQVQIERVEVPVERVVERVIEKEVVRYVDRDNGGNQPVGRARVNRNGVRIIIVTGERKTGITRTALSMSAALAKRSSTLFVDMDVKYRGSLLYLGIENIASELYHIQNGLKVLQNLKSLRNSVYPFTRGGFDCLLSSYGEDVDGTQLLRVAKILATQREYKNIIIDCPMHQLVHLEEIIHTAEVMVCVDSNLQSLLNTVQDLDQTANTESLENTLFAESLYNSIHYLLSEGSTVNEFNTAMGTIASWLDYDGDHDWSMVPLIGKVDALGEALKRLT